MTTLKPRPQAVFRFVAPVRAAMQRFTFAFLVLMSVALMMLSKADIVIVERARGVVADLLMPVLDAVSGPASKFTALTGGVREFADMHRENARLREDLTRLERWQEIARKLEAENAQLRHMLNFAPEPGVKFVTGRVVADSGGAFVRSLLIAAGADQGVAKGHVAMSGDGLAGRITEVGARSARILLITDLNSRIPVIVESTRERAVLAGDNSGYPRLLYLPQSSRVQPGDRIVTSGSGGSMPAGLPVGIVTTVEERGPQVLPYTDWSRLEHVRVVDYGQAALQKDVPAPTAAAPQPPGKRPPPARPAQPAQPR